MASGDASAAPVAVVCVGMAGSGKTTFMQQINAYLHRKSHESVAKTNTDETTSIHPGRASPYVMNLDPAVRSVPFESNIDIRDSVNYKEVMKQYNLGPNGAILTSLNLFSTKIDQVMSILEKRCLVPSATQTPTTKAAAATSASTSTSSSSHLPSHIIVDTPGQIEVFVWSASGNILLSSLASSFPTVIAYVIDTPRTTENTSTFMSNMLYAISILYKTRLPMVLVFNKTDVKSEAEAVDWMRDFESFQDALRREEDDDSRDGGGGGGGGYMGALLNSMSLVLEEFYNHLSVVGVSSMTGDGVDKFFEAVEEKRLEFERDYKPELQRRREEAEKQKAELKDSEVRRMMSDMQVSSRAKGTGKYAQAGAAGKDEPETVSDLEDAAAEEDDDENEHEGLVEPDDENEQELIDQAFEEGLKARYEAALRDSGGATDAATFAADYMRRSQR